MPIYKGSQLINTISVGGVIKQVYRGSTLVYSGGVKELPIYQWGVADGYAHGSVGSWSPNSTNIGLSIYGSTVYLSELTNITGTLGEANSTVKASSYGGRGSENVAKFNRLLTDSDGNLFYIYGFVEGYVIFLVAVSPKQQVGDKVPTAANVAYIVTDATGNKGSVYWPDGTFLKTYTYSYKNLVGSYTYRS